MEITKETKLDKVLEIEGAEEVLFDYEVPCLSCPYAKYEMAELDLETICNKYGIDCDKLIEDLNNIIK
ncbi:MAG: hypothetical protein PHW52_01405 [Candidatus Pacebacteria bacterium]|nr:hypothetical protein [Candidatus Paceibacterota bacterium]